MERKNKLDTEVVLTDGTKKNRLYTISCFGSLLQARFAEGAFLTDIDF